MVGQSLNSQCVRVDEADHPVAVEVVVKTTLARFQGQARSRYSADAWDEVAVTIGIPDRILIVARNLPGNLISACRLFRANRRPGVKLTRDNGRAGKFQHGARPAAVMKIKIIRNLRQAGRPIRLDHCGMNADHAVAVEVLMETAFSRFKGKARS